MRRPSPRSSCRHLNMCLQFGGSNMHIPDGMPVNSTGCDAAGWPQSQRARSMHESSKVLQIGPKTAQPLDASAEFGGFPLSIMASLVRTLVVGLIVSSICRVHNAIFRGYSHSSEQPSSADRVDAGRQIRYQDRARPSRAKRPRHRDPQDGCPIAGTFASNTAIHRSTMTVAWCRWKSISG